MPGSSHIYCRIHTTTPRMTIATIIVVVIATIIVAIVIATIIIVVVVKFDRTWPRRHAGCCKCHRRTRAPLSRGQ